MSEWKSAEDDHLEFPEPHREPVKIDKKADRKFSKIVFIALILIFGFIYAKACFGTPVAETEKFPGGIPDPYSLPANCRYLGLTVDY
jgi:hypothetical protein